MKKWLSVLLGLLFTMTSFISCDMGYFASQGGDMRRLDMSKLSENIEKIAEYDISNTKIFGSAYYVYQEGGVELKKCYGTTSLDSNAPITDTSIFRLASMTKPITAIAALILVDRGLLSLNDSVDKYIPEFKNIEITSSNSSNKPKKLPSIKSLLNHTSGIGCDANKLATMTANDKKTLDSSIAFYIKNGLDFEPESQQQYSPTGAFDVLAKIIEIVSGKDYLSFLKTEIFEPCGMQDTTFVPTAEQEERMVAMHTRKDGENAVSAMLAGCVFENFPSTHYLGGAGLVSTLSDYGKFAKMLLNKGKTEKGRILREETFDLLCTPQVSKKIMPGDVRWGLGVRVITGDGYPYSLPVGSFGWSGAYGTHFWIDPVNKIFAVFMKNSRVDGGAGNQSAVEFEKAVYASLAE